jgi:hypothetical protein
MRAKHKNGNVERRAQREECGGKPEKPAGGSVGRGSLVAANKPCEWCPSPLLSTSPSHRHLSEMAPVKLAMMTVTVHVTKMMGASQTGVGRSVMRKLGLMLVNTATDMATTSTAVMLSARSSNAPAARGCRQCAQEAPRLDPAEPPGSSAPRRDARDGHQFMLAE